MLFFEDNCSKQLREREREKKKAGEVQNTKEARGGNPVAKNVAEQRAGRPLREPLNKKRARRRQDVSAAGGTPNTAVSRG